MAQDNELDTTLKNLYKEFWTRRTEEFDTKKVSKILSLINESNYRGLSDSAKYSFHYFSAGIYHDNEDKGNEKPHIDEAVKLSETSMGILNPEYLELLAEQGEIMEEFDIDRAINIYQKGLIVAQTILNVPKAQTFNFKLFTDNYGNLMSSLAELYDKKGWTSRIDELYKTAFRFRTYYSPKNEASTYVDLHMLANYYERNNDINKSIELLEWEKEYIKDNGYYGSSAYVDALYFLGSYYSKACQEEKSLDAYRTAVELTCDSLGGEDETLMHLYGNYCIKLAELSKFKELDEVLSNARKYYLKEDTINAYANILFLITDKLYINKMYDEADKYCDSLLLYPSYNEGYEEITYSKKALILFMLNMLDKAQGWQEKALKYCLIHNGENSVIYTNYLADLAFLYKKNSLTEKSINTYYELIELLEKNNRDTIPFYNQKINEVCELYNEEKSYEVEYQFLKERKQISSEKYGKRTLFYAWICNTLSIFEMNTGRLVEAKENNLIAEKLYLDIEGRHSLNYAAAIHNKGRLLMLEGKNKQALKYLKESKEIQFSISGRVFENTEMYIHEIEDKQK